MESNANDSFDLSIPSNYTNSLQGSSSSAEINSSEEYFVNSSLQDGTKITYSSGSSAISFGDLYGNITTDYYTKGGTLYADSWSYANGSFGSDTFQFALLNQKTLTAVSGSSSLASVATTGCGTSVNADGSYTSYADGLEISTSNNATSNSSTVSENPYTTSST